MDIREYPRDDEETLLTAFAGMMRDLHFVTPCVMSEDTKDGHRCTPQPSIQRAVTDPATGELFFTDHPLAPDTLVHFAGGKKVVATHPVAKNDEGVVIYADRALDVPMQQSGTGQPIDSRQHHAADGIYIPGIRSDPRKLQQVDNDAHHVRSVDKKTVSEVHPDNGVTHKAVDPSTAPASESFDPFAAAQKFFLHATHPTNGILGQATDGGSTHTHGVTHETGAFMRALSGLHSVLCDPNNGSSLNALMGLHSVLAHPAIGALLSGNNGSSTVLAGASGVSLTSDKAISMVCPPGGFSMPLGSASSNVGPLSGDLSGTLPNVKVVSVLNVSNANLLPNAANDSAAAALTPPVAIGALYRNGSQLMVRIA